MVTTTQQPQYGDDFAPAGSGLTIGRHFSPVRAYIAYHRLDAAPMSAAPATPAPATPPACAAHPSVFYLMGTLLLTSCSTAMLCGALMTEHWELVSWERGALAALANASRVSLQWLLDDKVAKIEDTSKKKGYGTFLVPMRGGIWTMCAALSDEEVASLRAAGLPPEPLCTAHLAPADHDEPRADWQHRMQNLSISCALVCLIVLGAAALLGVLGVCRHQISAVLVTGVMYLLAGLFAMFTLLIIHVKRSQRGRGEGAGAGGVLGAAAAARALLPARAFDAGWSLDLGWAGVALAALTSLLWIMLSKIMRYNPISTMLL